MRVLALVALAACTDSTVPATSDAPSDGLTDAATDSGTVDSADPTEPEDVRNTVVACADIERDVGADGTVDSLRRIATNADGELLFEANDGGADGNDNSRISYVYTDDILFSDSVFDLDNDGILQSVGTSETMLASGVLRSYTLDTDGDGTLESELVTVDETPAGDPTDQTWTTNGNVERQTSTYDAERRRTRWEIDRGDDGTIEQVLRYTYSATLDVRLRDNDGDGADDERFETLYDAQGRITTTRTDSPLGKPWEIVETRTYGPNGLEQTVRDNQGNITTTNDSRDTMGRIQKQEVVTTGNTTEETWTWRDCTKPDGAAP